MYRCRICGGEWTEIPPDAVEITATYRGALYKFGGAIHDLRTVVKPAPPVIAKPNPPVEQLLVQEVQAPVPEQNLPVVAQLEILPPEIEDESELTSITTLSAAFNRIRK
jgi:hypothetical protein